MRKIKWECVRGRKYELLRGGEGSWVGVVWGEEYLGMGDGSRIREGEW